MFSFFNAGRQFEPEQPPLQGSAVHQAVHLRLQIHLSAYIMSPASEGAFTMVMGHHSYHHDTSAFPTAPDRKGGLHHLMPGANYQFWRRATSEKWPARDRRSVKRDVIN